MPKSKKAPTLDQMLTDPTVPLGMRIDMMRQLFVDSGDDAQKVIAHVLDAATAASAGRQYVAKTKALARVLDELQEGPLRFATFDRIVESERLGRRAQVILPDGGFAFCSVPDEKLADAMRCGDSVWLDTQGRAVLFHQPDPVALGEEARLDRVLPGDEVEVSVGELGRLVVRNSARLRDQLASGEAEPGSTLVVCQRRLLAFRALPRPDGPSHLRFLSQQPVPDVVVGRDLGAPPDFIESFSTHVRRELSNAAIGRRYGLRRSRLLLATGVAGSGKTFSILALWRRLYEIMSELTGVSIDALPQRVLQLRAADVLSKWVGGSDRRIARFFDEVDEVAGQTFTAPDGREWELPVIVICEEIDALARQRGEDAIYDRIQTTLLTRLDPAHELYRDRVVIVICTSNVPSLLDVAFVRRAGGTVARFGRLGRTGFRSVLAKHLQDRPLQNGGLDQMTADLTAWLFAPNGSDPGQVEINFVGQPNPVTKHRRDFLTAGLIDRAIQAASAEACDAEWRGEEEPGLSTQGLMRAIDAQVRAIVEQLSPANCESYLDLPDAVRVGTLRRIAQSPVLPIHLERAH